MDMQPVESSHISHLGYDAETQTLAVQFHRGGVYHYENVPQATYAAMLNADSVGTAFKVFVKHNPAHPHRRAP